MDVEAVTPEDVPSRAVESNPHGDANLKEKLREQLQLLFNMGNLLKETELKRIVMEKRNANLLNENRALQIKLAEETKRSIELSTKCDQLQSCIDNQSVVVDAYNSLSQKIAAEGAEKWEQKEKTGKCDQATSTEVLEVETKETQVTTASKSCEDGSGGNVVELCKSDVQFLDAGLQALKECILKREQTWEEIESKEKSQRSWIKEREKEIALLKSRVVENRKEMDNKEARIKELIVALKVGDKEIAFLRKLLQEDTRSNSSSTSRRSCSDVVTRDPGISRSMSVNTPPQRRLRFTAATSTSRTPVKTSGSDSMPSVSRLKASRRRDAAPGDAFR